MLIPLNVQSAYSLLESPLRLEDYVKKAKGLGFSMIGLADINVMSGVLAFYRLCQAEGIGALLGLTLRLPSPLTNVPFEDYILYAKNYRGYQRLLALSSQYQMAKNDDEKKQVLANLTQDNADLMVILPPAWGRHMAYLKNGQKASAEAWLSQFRQYFARNLYIGVSEEEIWQYYLKDLVALSQACHLPLLALPLIQYLEPSDLFTQNVLLAIKNQVKLDDPKALAEISGRAYLRPLAYYEAAYTKLPLQIDWSKAMDAFRQCQVTIAFHQALLPRFSLPEGERSDEKLAILAREGLAKRGLQTRPYKERLDYELRVISQMGFTDYFLLVWDVMRYARSQEIMTGPGRGSAAGSLVAYALSITDVDPVLNNLLFERFLNPERQNMPDIDLDFPDNRRDDLLAYVYQKYGNGHVAQIATFGTFAARMALRDVGSVLNQPQSELKRWSSTVKNQNESLRHLLTRSGRLDLYRKENDLGDLWVRAAMAIEGLPRHVSTHASGVVISDSPLTEHLALQAGTSGNLPLTQLTMGDVEALGLLKIDFLSLINLSILEDCYQGVKQRLEVSIHFERNDPRVMQIFKQGDTLGVFQFESSGIRQALKAVQPENLAELADVNALYRPGPMQGIQHYVARKFKRESVKYPHEDLKEILAPTYGVMVYQEQVMQVAQKFAGFTLGQADILRRAIGKKQHQLIEKMRTQFEAGAREKGYDENVIQAIYHLIEAFADYGFNKSHAYAYAYLAYDLAWYKAYYPAAFYYGNLRHYHFHEKKGIQLAAEAQSRGIEILPPDINKSQLHLSLTKEGAIRLGLGDIRRVPRNLVYDILNSRQHEGPFKDMHDLLSRLVYQHLSKEALENLAWSGALDSLCETRRTLIEEAIPKLLAHEQLFQKNSSKQACLPLSFMTQEEAIFRPKIKKLSEYDTRKLFLGECDSLGQGVTVKLFSEYAPYYEAGLLTYAAQIKQNGYYQLVGEVMKVKEIQTKRQEKMAFIDLQDSSGVISVTLFSQLYQKANYLLKEGSQIAIWGRGNYRRDAWQLVADDLIPLTPAFLAQLEERLSKKNKAHLPKIYLQIEEQKHLKVKLAALESLCIAHPGPSPCVIYVKGEDKAQVLARPYQIQLSPTSQMKLEEIFGKENIIIKK